MALGVSIADCAVSLATISSRAPPCHQGEGGEERSAEGGRTPEFHVRERRVDVWGTSTERRGYGRQSLAGGREREMPAGWTRREKGWRTPE